MGVDIDKAMGESLEGVGGNPRARRVLRQGANPKPHSKAVPSANPNTNASPSPIPNPDANPNPNPDPNPNPNPNPKSLTLTPRRHGSQHVAQTGCGGILRHEKGTHTLSLPCVHGDGVGVNSALQCLTPSCGVFAAVEGLDLLSCHVSACMPACLPV